MPPSLVSHSVHCSSSMLLGLPHYLTTWACACQCLLSYRYGFAQESVYHKIASWIGKISINPIFRQAYIERPELDHLTWETIPVFAHLCQFAGRVAGLFHLISDVFCDHQILTMIFSLTTPSFHWDRQDTWGMKHQTWDIQQAADYSIY